MRHSMRFGGLVWGMGLVSVLCSAVVSSAASLFPAATVENIGDGSVFVPYSVEMLVPADSEVLAAAAARARASMFAYGPGFPVPANGSVRAVIVALSVPLSPTVSCERGFDVLARPDESYELRYEASNFSVLVSANTTCGALRALQSLQQLVTFNATTQQYSLPEPLEVRDSPRYPFRGLLLDTSRHFYRVEVVLALLDAIAMHKGNVLTWHITDKDSFPLVPDFLPAMGFLGSFPPSVTHTYTEADVRRVVEYARARGIEVILEMDGPVHSQSWGKGCPDCVMRNGSRLKDMINPLPASPFWPVLRNLSAFVAGMQQTERGRKGGGKMGVNRGLGAEKGGLGVNGGLRARDRLDSRRYVDSRDQMDSKIPLNSHDQMDSWIPLNSHDGLDSNTPLNSPHSPASSSPPHTLHSPLSSSSSPSSSSSSLIGLGGDEVVVTDWLQSPAVVAWAAAVNRSLSVNNTGGPWTADTLVCYFHELRRSIAAEFGLRSLFYDDAKQCTNLPRWNESSLPVVIDVWDHVDAPASAVAIENGFYVIVSSYCYDLDLNTTWVSNFEANFLCDIANFSLPNASLPLKDTLLLGGHSSRWSETTDGTNLFPATFPGASAAFYNLWSAQAQTGPQNLPQAMQRYSQFRCFAIHRGYPLAPAQVDSHCDEEFQWKLPTPL